MPLIRNNQATGLDSDLDQDGDDFGAPRANRKRNDRSRRRARMLARKKAAAEQVGESVEHLVANISLSTESMRELTDLMEQIAAGSEQSASVCRETLSPVNQVALQVERMLKETNQSRQKSTEAQLELSRINSTITEVVSNVAKASEHQQSSLTRMTELEQLAARVSDSVGAVIRIADQTNLLALNAAIEAARAGKHGKGFAVVADHVRNLAETAEKNAANIEELIQQIRAVVVRISKGVSVSAEAAREEVARGQKVHDKLASINETMQTLHKDTTLLDEQAATISTAIEEARRGSESITAASEEQSAACEESLQTLRVQNDSVANYKRAVENLVSLAAELRNSQDEDLQSSAEEVGASSDALSVALDDFNRASSEILVAIREISHGAAQQNRSVERILGGLEQIDDAVKQCAGLAANATSRVHGLVEKLEWNRQSIADMISGVNRSLEQGQANLVAIQDLEKISKHIDKIVYAIANVAIQTSMLAVNGAVESARAGDYGKGFAVVSGDIQNLASDAANNAEEIKDLVKAIQEQIIVVRLEMSSVAERSATEVQRGGHILEGIQALEREFSGQVQSNVRIQQAMEEIARAIAHIKSSIAQISVSSSQTNSASSLAFETAKRQSGNAEALASIINDIASTAEELHSD